jgi:hypothetical protein
MALSASAKFKAHAFRMCMFAVLFAAAVILMSYAILSLVKTWPKTVTTLNLGDSVQETEDDDYKDRRAPDDEVMYPGGSEVEEGVLDSLGQYDRYNTVLRRVSKDTGIGEIMVDQSLKDRRILSSKHDEWDRTPYYTSGASQDPAAISREVTLFNL